jgi:hypothetical protein
MTSRKLIAASFIAPTLCGAALIGCGGSGAGPKAGPPVRRVSSVSAPASSDGQQAAAPALAACKRAVAKPMSLSGGAKREIAELCDRINTVIEDNEATVKAVCQELANAVTQSAAATRKRTYSTCYSEYAQTLK